MFTETELREALVHSAARAESLPEPHARISRRRVVVPLAAAAAVAALAVGSAVLAQHPHTTQPAAASTPAPRPSAAVRVDEHVPVDLSNAVDLLQARSAADAYYTIGGNGVVEAGTENYEMGLSGRRLLDVTIVASSALNASRIPREQPVPIAGTTGYFTRFKLFPLDASTGPGSDKYTSPWTIAFPSPAGHWVFVSIQNGVDFDGVDDPSAVAAAYDSAGLRFAANETRLPFRTGYLPAGFRLDDISAGHGEVWVSLTDGSHRIELDVLRDRAAGDCAGACGATKRVGAFTVNVLADGYDPTPKSTASVRKIASGAQPSAPTPIADALAQRVLDSLTLAPDLTDPSTYWTIAAALG